MKKIAKEFRDFITRGNVLDMAVGVIVGGAFGKIIGDIDLSQLNIILSPAVTENGEVVKEAVTLGIGTFIATIIDFLLVALCIFLVVKAFNKARALSEKRKKEAEAEAEPAEQEPTREELLMTEIRDLLKEKK